MVESDRRIDTYIEHAPPFAQEILKHVRKHIHAVCPDIKETIKWGSPTFEHRGLLFSMAAHKAHCNVIIWNGAILDDPHNLLTITENAAMGNLGKVASLEDLPAPDILDAYLREAWNLNNEGAKVAPAPKRIDNPDVPADLKAALTSQPNAWKNFEAFTASQQKEYVDWIENAKRSATRENRIAQAGEWIEEGKQRNWKYMK